jgi:hypothetical protein
MDRVTDPSSGVDTGFEVEDLDAELEKEWKRRHVEYENSAEASGNKLILVLLCCAW